MSKKHNKDHALTPKEVEKLEKKMLKEIAKEEKKAKKEAEKLAEHSTGNAAGRALSRLMLAGASEADVDSAGRILVPDYLKSFAGLSVKAVVAGVSGRVELWDETAWTTYTKQIEKNADDYINKAKTYKKDLVKLS